MLMILCWIPFIVTMTTLHCLGTFQSPFYLAANLQLLTASFIHHLGMLCLSDLPWPPPILSLLSPPISNLVCIFCAYSAPQRLPPTGASSLASFLSPVLQPSGYFFFFFFFNCFCLSLSSVLCNTERTQGAPGVFVVILKFSEPLVIDHLCSWEAKPISLLDPGT